MWEVYFAFYFPSSVFCFVYMDRKAEEAEACKEAMPVIVKIPIMS